MEAKRFIVLQTIGAVQSGSITVEEGVDEIMQFLDKMIKPLHEENQELVNKVIKEVETGSRSRDKLADLKLSIEPTETIINGFANLFDGYVKEKELQEKYEDSTMTAFNLNEIRKDQYITMEKMKEELKAKRFDKEDLELIFDKFDYHGSFETQFNEYFN